MEELSRSKRVFLSAGPFPALAFFKIWAASSPNPRSLALIALFMLLFCFLVLWVARRWDEPSYFDWTVAIYFALLSVLLTGWPESVGSFLSNYSVTGIYSCLFAAAFIPPVLGLDPFTLHYARKTTPQPFWENPLFIKINRLMTYAWSGLFAVFILISLYPSLWTRAIIPIALIAGVGFPFNLKFPDYYLRRSGFPSRRELRQMAATMDRPPVPPGLPHEPPSVEQTNAVARGKETAMKVLALNSSARTGGESKTELILNHLVDGMRQGGAEVEVIDLRRKTIKQCAGCFTCWTKTPGVCIHQDDMTREIFPKWLDADLVVYATPLFHYTMNARMKTFVERTLPALQPFFGRHEDQTFHPWRKSPPKAVFVSVAGFPEMSIFDLLSSWVKFIYGRSGGLLAEIYRPGAEMLTHPQFREKAGDILAATEEAGREIVEERAISPATLARVTQTILDDKEIFYQVGNLMWKNCIAQGMTPREFAEKGIPPRPDSLESFMLIMPMGFNEGAAGDLQAVLQFHFKGDIQGSCYFEILQGKIQAVSGTAARPDLTIEASFETWVDIMTGKLDGQKAFLEKKFGASGDFSLLLRMSQIFGK